MESRLNAYLELLETLTPDTVQQLQDLASDQFQFKDPFNHTHSRRAFIEILNDMYRKLDNVDFVIHATIEGSSEAMIQWTFSAENSVLGHIRFNGMSHIQIDEEGRVISHIDYWDGSELMQRLPIIGRGISALKKRFKHNA